MELKIKVYEKEGKRCCYIEDGKENGQEYRDISLEMAWRDGDGTVRVYGSNRK